MSVSQSNSNLDDELLSAFIDGELTDAERAAVEARLETDPAARELVAEMRSLSGTLKSLPREPLADDLRSAVLEQIGDSQVALPRVELTMARRLMWPAIAIAAALMLMFVQQHEDRDIDDVAKVEVRGEEMRERLANAEHDAAFEAPAEAPVAATAAAPPAASAPATAGDSLVADTAVAARETAAGTIALGVAEEPAIAARRAVDEMAATDAELEGVVHLTLTDFRSGAERFNRLLLSNGVQLVDGDLAQPDATSGAPATDAVSTDGQPTASALSSRAAAPSEAFGGYGGVATESTPGAAAPVAGEAGPEPEMVLVEAPPQQIEQILVSCSQDTEAIQEVAVDPTASGLNAAPDQRLVDYQQYSRGSSVRGHALGRSVTREEQNAIAVFNSLPKQAQAPVPELEDQQQGWAARFRAIQQPMQAQELNAQYNQYRHQYFSSQAQQSVAKGEALYGAKKLATDKVGAGQPMRVLFLLHPSGEAAKQ